MIDEHRDATCDVIVPVKGAIGWVEQCLGELFRQCAREVGVVWVVDDGSTDEDRARLAQVCARHDAVRLVPNSRHAGFGGACNTGARLSRAEHLLFLNSDCLVTPGTVRKLVATARADAAIGLACPL